MNQTALSAVSWVCNGLTILAATISENPIAQWILFGLGILSSLVSIAFSIIRIGAKWKEINADGKITAEEYEELKKELADAKKEVEDASKKEDNTK